MNQSCFLKFRRVFCAIGFTLLLFGPSTSSAQTTARQFMHGQVPQAVTRFHLRPVGRPLAAMRLNLAIGLPLRNEATLNQSLQDIYNPASPNFRHYLTPEEFAQQFGPAESNYQAVITFARTNGLTVTGTNLDRTLVYVSASVADIERIFHVTMRLYRHPTENRNFFAPDTEPSLNLAVPILHISGLDNYVIPHPAGLQRIPLNQLTKRKSNAGSGPYGTYMANDFRAAYAPGISLNGSNQVVGLFELDGYYASDITAYEASNGLPNVALTNVLTSTSGAAGNDNSEVALDIEMALAMAPGLSRVIVYEGPNPVNSTTITTMLGKMATDNLAKQISSSWVIGDDPNFDVKYKQFAMQGQSFFQSSGDHGAYYSGLTDSEDDTNVTIVGGTTLSTAGPSGSYLSETVWNEYSNGEGAGGSGGGISLHSMPIPSWQTGISMTANQGSTTLRNIPDVAMTADSIYAIADNGQQETLIGTSAAAPLWAGFAALVNQQAVASSKGTVGFINPAVYAIGKSPFYLSDFHDITTGNNTNATVANKYPAVAGYDLCTGWGTPNGLNMITALATPDALGVLPGAGFTANGPAGGPFDITGENFTVTNTGGSSLNWVTIAPSWLDVTPDSGTLTAAGSVPVTVDINAAGYGFPPGIYSANVLFTNLATGIVQTRPFVLKIGQSLVANGGFENGDFSDWIFDGDSSSGGFLVNGVVDSSFGGSGFIHSGTYGAVFGQAGGLAYLSQTLVTVPGQSYLLSFWFDNFSSATPNQFQVNWNTNATSTNSIFNRVNLPPTAGWTNYLFVVTATGTNTVLQFGLENDAYYLGLDDITVQAIPSPTIISVGTTNNAIEFTWNSLANLAYQIQYSTNLAAGNWINLGGSLNATGFTTTATNSIGTDSQRFYRIQWLH